MGKAYNVVRLEPQELVAVHHMYDQQVVVDIVAYRPGIFGFKAIPSSFRGKMESVAKQAALVCSTSDLLRKVMVRLIPRWTFLPLVARHEPNIVGYAYVRILGRDSHGCSGELGIAVSKHHQGKGIGRLLLDKVVEEARAMNMKRIELTAATDNCRAIRL